jgi:osmotically inducible lipoprotein OsmB
MRWVNKVIAFGPRAGNEHNAYKESIMNTSIIAKLVIGATLAISAVGCSTWDGMSGRQKSTAVGAGAGGLVGAAVSGGGILGTVGGAAIGGVVGDQVGKNR